MQDWGEWLFCVKIFFLQQCLNFFIKKKSKKRKNCHSIRFACFNILSSFFWETKCKPVKNIHRDVLPLNWKNKKKNREFSRISPEKIIYVSLASFHSVMFTVLSFVPFDHILFWNCCPHFCLWQLQKDGHVSFDYYYTDETYTVFRVFVSMIANF